MAATTVTPTSGGKRPWLAAALSIVIPGIGHAYLSRYRRAILWITPGIVALIGVAATSRLSATDLIGAALDPTTLWAVFGLNVLAALWRIGAAVDAYHIARPEGRREMLPVGVGMLGWFVLMLILIAPHIVVGRYTLDALTLLDTVFVVDGSVPAVEPIIPIGTDAELVPDPVVTRYEVSEPHSVSTRNRIFSASRGDPDAVEVWEEIIGSRGSPRVDAPFLSFTERVGVERITILLAGGDGGPGRGGMRTDTMMVATLDTLTGKAALFGFPRNLGQVPLPRRYDTAFMELEQRLIPKPSQPTGEDQQASTTTTVAGEEPPTVEEPAFRSCRCFPDQLNALYPFTRRWTRTYPNEVDPGMAVLRDTLEQLMGLRIDYYALVDMAAFVDLVDAIGGVDVYVQKPLESEVSPPREGDPWAYVNVDVGWNHLNGPEALAYSRARKGSSDYTRMQRQRCMLRAVAAKADPLTLLRRFSAIVDAVEGSVVTDIPLSFAPDFITAAAKLDFDDIETVGFVPSYWAPERDYGGRPIPDVGRIRGKVRRVIEGQSTPSVDDTVDSECDA